MACAGLLAALRLLAVDSGWVEDYAESVTPEWIGFLSRATGWFSFSAAEIIVVSLVLGLLILACLLVHKVLQGKTSLLQIFKRGAQPCLTLAGIILVLGYAGWGIHYARAPLLKRLHWETLLAEPIDRDELDALATEAVILTNQSYREAFVTQDLGVVSEAPPQAELEAALEEGFQRVGRRLRLGASFQLAPSPGKPVLLSELLSRLGISGFFFPWTSETNYNRLPPAAERIHSLAHEKAHRRAITSEDEANFFGFLAAAASPNPAVRYSAYLFAQKQLIRELWRSDADAARELAAARLPGVQRDLDAEIAFWKQYEGPERKVSARINDSYLKFHGVEEGISSYALSARLLVAFSRSQGRSIEVSGAAASQ